MASDVELLERGEATLAASWAAYATGVDGAALHHLAGLVAAVFPSGPERGVYNNALLERGMTGARRRAAIDAMEATYFDAGVEQFAAWVHDSDPAMGSDLEQRGYHVDTSTLAMGSVLGTIDGPPPDLVLAELAWDDYLRVFDLPPGLLELADRDPFRVLVALLGDEPVTTAMSFDHLGDCGIYNVGTVERARRRGLGAAITAFQLYQAADRGCTTASLQATAMAERVYAATGFTPLGRYVEYICDGGRPAVETPS